MAFVDNSVPSQWPWIELSADAIPDRNQYAANKHMCGHVTDLPGISSFATQAVQNPNVQFDQAKLLQAMQQQHQFASVQQGQLQQSAQLPAQQQQQQQPSAAQLQQHQAAIASLLNAAAAGLPGVPPLPTGTQGSVAMVQTANGPVPASVMLQATAHRLALLAAALRAHERVFREKMARIRVWSEQVSIATRGMPCFGLYEAPVPDEEQWYDDDDDSSECTSNSGWDSTSSYSSDSSDSTEADSTDAEVADADADATEADTTARVEQARTSGHVHTGSGRASISLARDDDRRPLASHAPHARRASSSSSPVSRASHSILPRGTVPSTSGSASGSASGMASVAEASDAIGPIGECPSPKRSRNFGQESAATRLDNENHQCYISNTNSSIAVNQSHSQASQVTTTAADMAFIPLPLTLPVPLARPDLSTTRPSSSSSSSDSPPTPADQVFVSQLKVDTAGGGAQKRRRSSVSGESPCTKMAKLDGCVPQVHRVHGHHSTPTDARYGSSLQVSFDPVAAAAAVLSSMHEYAACKPAPVSPVSPGSNALGLSGMDSPGGFF